jgi:membrane fusion protein, multidrug efflux system
MPMFAGAVMVPTMPPVNEPRHVIPVTFTIPEDDVLKVVGKLDARQPQTIEAYDRGGLRKIGEGFLVGVDNQIDASTGMLPAKARS